MTYKKKLNYKDLMVSVVYDTEGLNIQVKDSYHVTAKADIKEVLKLIMDQPEFSVMTSNGFTRTPQSMYTEWCAHNLLYKWGYAMDRTRDVDIDQKETAGRKFVYGLLAAFYRG